MNPRWVGFIRSARPRQDGYQRLGIAGWWTSNYVPLAELSRLGLTDLQRRKDIARLYSQSAGLATFLVHGREGEYRPALVKLLQLIYTGRDKPNSLEQLTGRSFAELDRLYREYLEGLKSPTVGQP